ncbi:hypothetical protein ACFVV7_33790 [Streptomyces globisporus]|uniref:hypothetical protein n=1 Tax=Streptomyces globisporus TaxID=1908 RepID=UPI0036D7F040
MTQTTTAASSNLLITDVREALRQAGVQQHDDQPGLPSPEVETWHADGQVILKVTLAPDERAGAEAIPGRVQRALREHGLVAVPSPGAAPGPKGPALDALGSGYAVRIVRGH